ncbi:1505_t:CDS:1 [Paraglomus brasilianum]|uniref:1505_t:CDS:1 n=1 Tax=Paraglomus brasilianum TaxID=144538 RepID=A0A9N9A5I2_9GLOM|nr:1505_t:CDS:1 [Paraglomus brasilianum]
MKLIIIPLVEQNVSGCDCFEPAHKFDAKWCLDLHGYLNREEFAARLREVNNFIKAFPLLSKRSKRYLTYGIGGVIVLILFAVLAIAFSGSAGKNPGSTYAITVVIEALLSLALPIGRKIVDNMAKNRAEIFTQNLEPVLEQFNRKENPTANWKLVWIEVLTHYNINMNSDGKGTATPKYAEHAELVIEINDALSDLTAQTVRVNLAPTTSPVMYTNNTGVYAPQMVNVA